MPRSSAAKKLTDAFKMDSNVASSDTLLYKFFVDSVRDIYWAEKQITKALPKMVKSATSEELKSALSEHLEVTNVHVERLENVFEELGETARGKKCEGMEGIIAEGKSVIEETEEGTATRDVGLIMSAQKVEHYEIATYGSLVQLARTLGQHEVAKILEETLEEEKEADVLLTEIAENNINYEAAEEDL